MKKRTLGTFSSTLSAFVGSTLVHQLTDRDPGRAPLRIGSQTWSAQQLATELGLTNTRAARLLTEAAKGYKNLRDLYQRSTPYTFALRGIGNTTMLVLWRLFESQGFDPDRWATAGDTNDAMIAFTSLKKREEAADRRTKEAAKARHRTNSRTAYTNPLETHVH